MHRLHATRVTGRVCELKANKLVSRTRVSLRFVPLFQVLMSRTCISVHNRAIYNLLQIVEMGKTRVDVFTTRAIFAKGVLCWVDTLIDIVVYLVRIFNEFFSRLYNASFISLMCKNCYRCN